MSRIQLPHHHTDSADATETLISHLPPKEAFPAVADYFKLLDDGTRLQIFWILCHTEECVMNLSAILGMSSPAVSHHLKLLKTGGLIVSRRQGKEVYYKASERPEIRHLHSVIEALCEIACPISNGSTLS